MQAAALLGRADFYRFQGGTLAERTRAAAALLERDADKEWSR